MWRGQPGGRPGKWLEVEGTPGNALHILHLSWGGSWGGSSRLDTNRRNKDFLIPSQPRPLAWHQLCAHSLQLAACSKRPGHRHPCTWGNRHRKGAQASNSTINSEQDKPFYTHPRPCHRTGIMPTLQDALSVCP